MKLQKLMVNKKFATILMCVSIFVICVIFTGSLANKSMTPSEGWYSYYGYLINEKGAVPYVDFELLFPPLYTYIIAFFVKIFGYNIIALRVLGVFVFAVMGILLCLIFKELFDNAFIGFVCGLVGVAYLQSEVAQVFYDYVRMMDLCVFAAIYFTLRFLKKRLNQEKFKIDIELIFASIFATGASLFKQSSGLVFIMACLAVLILFTFFAKNKKLFIANIAIFLITCVAIYGINFIILASQGALRNYLYYNFNASASAKGGIFTLLFVPIAKVFAHSYIALPAMALLLGVLWLIYNKKEKLAKSKPLNYFMALIIFATFVIVALIVAINAGKLTMAVGGKIKLNWLEITSFMFSFIILAVLFVYLLVKRKKLPEESLTTLAKIIFVSACAFAIAYATTMSAGLARGQVPLAIGLLVGCILSVLMRINYRVLSYVAVSVVCVFSVFCFAFKLVTVYSWWLLDVGNYWEQTYKLDGGTVLDGLYVNEQYYKMYTETYDLVKNNVKEGETIFSFPQIPIFYLYTNTDRATFTAIQWPDVSTDENVLKDIDTIKENKPKVLIFVDVPEKALAAHEDAFRGGKTVAMRTMRDFLLEFVKDGYEMAGRYEIAENYVVYSYLHVA